MANKRSSRSVSEASFDITPRHAGPIILLADLFTVNYNMARCLAEAGSEAVCVMDFWIRRVSVAG
jgi:hypothetical protein